MIIGHGKIIKDLKRLAERRRLGHGHLFFGPPGVGKGTVALGFARYFEGGAFDADGEHLLLRDATIIEPAPDFETGLPGDSIGIDRIREIRNFLATFPNTSAYRTVIIRRAELLTREAQNALLKIAEEPPAAALIILIAQDPERLLPTVQSRFQKLYFGPVPEKDIAAWLVRAHGCTAAHAKKAAAEAGGLPGLAYTLLFDERFKKVRAAAEQFLHAAPGVRAALAKDMVAEDDFNMAAFLDALVLLLAPALSTESRPRQSALSPRTSAALHAILELRRQSDYFNLNPRLQLTALAQLV